jgi:uncharacterized glyoxalase superfamily protein PhnB
MIFGHQIEYTTLHYHAIKSLFQVVNHKLNDMENQRKNPKRKSVKAIPDGFSSVTPYMIVDGASALIKFIEQSFNGDTTSIMKSDDGKIMHATVRIGDSQIMVSDSTQRYTAAPTRLYVYVNDIDAVYKKALDAGGISLREPIDEFYGDRSAGVKDNCGNEWWIATHVEDVSKDELKKRQKKFSEEVAA